MSQEFLEFLSRRDFLIRAVTLVSAIGVSPEWPRHNKPPDKEPKRPSEELPADVLTEQELEHAHIKIYQGKDTKLYLRQSIFEIPLFRDSKDGKIEEVLIVLVDDDRLYEESLDELPEEFVRPYHIFRQSENITKRNNQEFLENFKNKLETLEQELAEGKIDNSTYDQRRLWYERWIGELEKRIEVYNTPPRGLFFYGRKMQGLRPNLMEDQPELLDKVAIYIAAGEKETLAAVFLLHHETSHYEVDSEDAANALAKDRMDKGIYPFIFVNSEGMTFTKNLTGTDVSNSI